ncbi:MAG: hypothetical protein EBU96_04185 [Actinobacteria bacterium]|nr:hypothetical protein [Actinomycetota bacterium]
MASFQISDLKTSEVLDGSSFVPSTLTQAETFYDNGSPVSENTTVTRKLSVQALRTWFDSGIYKQIRSGASVKVTPENFTVSGTISFYSPGLTAVYAGASDPDGWFICDGRSVSTSQYSELFGVLGYVYGGSGNSFNIPDYRGRSVFGCDTVSGSAAGRSPTGIQPHLFDGASSVTLAQSECPLQSHTHPRTYFYYYRNYGTTHQGNNNTGDPSQLQGSGGDSGYCFAQSITVYNQGWGSAESSHANLPPYLNLNFIIKY